MAVPAGRRMRLVIMLPHDQVDRLRRMSPEIGDLPVRIRANIEGVVSPPGEDRRRHVLGRLGSRDRDGDAARLLTRREREVMTHVSNGLTNAEIARVLVIEPSTVRKHLEHVFEKLGVGSRTAAVAKLRTQGSHTAQPSFRDARAGEEIVSRAVTATRRTRIRAPVAAAPGASPDS
ncbi:MAG: response regulator transcription factor, partial [Actinobacteria bacterium]